MKAERFTASSPEDPDCPGRIYWIVRDEGQRISVARLVALANRLNRELVELKARLEESTEP